MTNVLPHFIEKMQLARLMLMLPDCCQIVAGLLPDYQTIIG